MTEHKFPAVAKGHGDALVIKDVPPLILHHPHIDASRANLEHGLALYAKAFLPNAGCCSTAIG